MARMIVTLVSMYFESRRPHGNFVQGISPQLGVSYFLCSGSAISLHESVKFLATIKQNSCPRCDDNRDAPIGCFVTKDDPSNMGVNQQ